MDRSETPQTLLKRIKERRRSIKSFIQHLEPKGILLTNVNIICSAIATVLTAGPAIGGKTLLDAINAFGPNATSWRILFALAALFSLASAIAANLYKSHDLAANLNKARACNAKLEGLETLLELDKISLDDAATQYTQFLPDISFVGDSSTVSGDHSTLDWVKGEITQPHSSHAVPNVITCSGWAEGLGSNLHLWLAVQIKNCIWPKEGEIFVDDDGSWGKTIHEQGVIESFSLCLFVANKKANKRIRAWLDKCDETGNYSELRRPLGLRLIHRVDDLHHKKSIHINPV
jgi:hypothetical protein